MDRRENVDPFIAACGELGDVTANLGAILKEAFDAQRSFLLMATQVWPSLETYLRRDVYRTNNFSLESASTVFNFFLKVKKPATQKLAPKLAALDAARQKANKAIQRNDFENHAKAVNEV